VNEVGTMQGMHGEKSETRVREIHLLLLNDVKCSKNLMKHLQSVRMHNNNINISNLLSMKKILASALLLFSFSVWGYCSDYSYTYQSLIDSKKSQIGSTSAMLGRG
jgi:hypothetical protein